MYDDNETEEEESSDNVSFSLASPNFDGEIQNYENEFAYQDLTELSFPLLIGTLKVKPYKIREFIQKNDLLINIESAKQLLNSRNLFHVLKRKRDPRIYYKNEKIEVNINAHFYLVKHFVYNLLCENGFLCSNSYDVALTSLSNPHMWINGPILSSALTNIFLCDNYLRSLLSRDHGNIKDWAKKRSKIMLPSLKDLNSDIDLTIDIITRQV
jgi:hypothetical protein